MRDRLIELLQNFADGTVTGNGTIVDGTKVDDVADHLLANGVIVPPCKVGDTLYVISHMKDKKVLPFINEYEATYIQVGKRKCKVYHEVDGYIKMFLQNDFGKTVFLTREEAEQALKGGEG